MTARVVSFAAAAWLALAAQATLRHTTSALNYVIASDTNDKFVRCTFKA